MPLLKYRLHGLRPPPRIIKLAIPGWAGEQQPRADGSHEQPWHCLPYTESARYGVELILHGHDHVDSTMWIDGPTAAIPAIGVPSASALAPPTLPFPHRGGRVQKRPTWRP